jgi:hypothetical protein
MANVPANPEAPVAKLQIKTLAPTNSHRDIRSASHPKIGAAIMYDSKNAVANDPIFAKVAAFWFDPKNVLDISGSTAASIYRSM